MGRCPDQRSEGAVEAPLDHVHDPGRANHLLLHVHGGLVGQVRKEAVDCEWKMFQGKWEI